MGKVSDPFLCDDRYIMDPRIWDHKLINGAARSGDTELALPMQYLAAGSYHKKRYFSIFLPDPVPDCLALWSKMNTMVSLYLPYGTKRI
jgi:hypothetical protein